MDKVFETICRAYNSLWHFRDYGNTLEIITPVATINNMFVSIFITKRGDDYVATDGGWMDAGLYECEINWNAGVFNKIYAFYIDNLDIIRSESCGRVFYYKKISKLELLPNIVFDMANFINAVVSSSNIQFVSDRIELGFKKEVKGYLIREFGEDRFEYDRPLSDEINIRFSAIERNRGSIKLINFVSGSNSSYYANTLCRSNMNFQMVLPFKERYSLDRAITLLDDRKRSVIDSPQVQTYYNYLLEQRNDYNKVILWSQKDELAQAM